MQNGARKIKTHNCLEQQVGHTLNKVITLTRDFHVSKSVALVLISTGKKSTMQVTLLHFTL